MMVAGWCILLHYATFWLRTWTHKKDRKENVLAQFPEKWTAVLLFPSTSTWQKRAKVEKVVEMWKIRMENLKKEKTYNSHKKLKSYSQLVSQHYHRQLVVYMHCELSLLLFTIKIPISMLSSVQKSKIIE